MKISPKIAKVPEDLDNLKFSFLRKQLKKDLLRFEKETSRTQPTPVILKAEHNYCDKPFFAGIIVFGKWKSQWKEYAKRQIAVKEPLGAIGQAYYGGVGPDGQKIIHIDIAKGKAANKLSKLQRGLKKLIPQATYNVIFGEVSEEDFDSLERKMDSLPDDENEIFEDADMEDEGQIEIDRKQQSARKLLKSNLKEISDTWTMVRDEVVPRLKAQNLEELDPDHVIDLIDLCEEWLELQQESPILMRLAFAPRVSQVRSIKEQTEKLLPYLPKREASPSSDASGSAAATTSTELGVEGDSATNNNEDLSSQELDSQSTEIPKIEKTIKAPVGVGGGSKEDTILVQTLLKAAGLDLGKFGPNKDGIDGDPGNTTIGAIKKFQKGKQLQATGIVAPDSNTWKALNKLPYETEVAPGTAVGQPINTAHEALETGLRMAEEAKYQKGNAYIAHRGSVTGKQYKPGDTIDPRDPTSKSTWCNQFTYDLTDSVLGNNSPFDFLPASKGWTNANSLFQFMEDANGVLFDEIGRFEEAWQHVNAGKLVYFVALGRQNSNQGMRGSGHVATGAPTAEDKMRELNGDRFGEVIQAGSKTGKFNILNVWGANSIGNVKIYLSRFQEPLAEGESQDPNLLLKIYNKISKPVGANNIISTSKGPQQDNKVVQQLLVNAGYELGKSGAFKNGVDGLVGANGATVKALRKLQEEDMRAAGVEVEVNGTVAMNDATWNYLYGKSKTIIESPAPNPNAPSTKPEDISFSYKGGSAALSANAEKTLRELLAKANEPQAIITSTLRTAKQQAAVMFLNLRATGPAFNRKMYKDKAAAEEVIKAYEQALAAAKAPNDIAAAMLTAINRVGADKLSAHCQSGNPAIDIHPSSIKNKALFEQVLRSDARVARLISPPADTTYHIELK